jgi:phosphocarrier protein HPr
MLTMGTHMISEPLRRKVVVANPQGMHMRPWTAFAILAGRFRSTVTVHCNGRTADGKGVLDLMLLVAEQGSELTIEADGPDAAEALDALSALVAAVPAES